MGVSTSIVVFAVGAILRFATTVQSSNFNVHTIGVILMVVGAVGFVVSLVFWASWGGFGGRRGSTTRRTVYRQPGDLQAGNPQAGYSNETVVDERHESQY